MRIIFATQNEGKIKEVKHILADTGYDVVTMNEAGIFSDIVEDGATFADNAIIKAVTVMKLSGEMSMSDDSGIEIDFLDKKPGVHSARYLGEDTPYIVKNTKILEMLKDVPFKKRTARFVSVIALAYPNGEVVTTTGTIEGYIGYEIKGENGFGYDPIFYVEEYDMTTAEMSPEIKNKISHRAIALSLMKEKLLSGGIAGCP